MSLKHGKPPFFKKKIAKDCLRFMHVDMQKNQITCKLDNFLGIQKLAKKL